MKTDHSSASPGALICSWYSAPFTEARIDGMKWQERRGRLEKKRQNSATHLNAIIAFARRSEPEPVT